MEVRVAATRPESKCPEGGGGRILGGGVGAVGRSVGPALSRRRRRGRPASGTWAPSRRGSRSPGRRSWRPSAGC